MIPSQNQYGTDFSQALVVVKWDIFIFWSTFSFNFYFSLHVLSNSRPNIYMKLGFIDYLFDVSIYHYHVLHI